MNIIMATDILQRELLSTSCSNNNNKCDYIKSSKFINLDKINPKTNRRFTSQEKNDILNQYKRVCDIKEGDVSNCCDLNEGLEGKSRLSTLRIQSIKRRYPSVRLNIDNGIIISMTLSKVKMDGSEWMDLTPHLICKLSKATIVPDKINRNFMLATNLLRDCFIDNCNNGEPELNLDTIIKGNSDIKYTFMDDAKAEEYIRDGESDNIKTYIREQQAINHPLTHNDFRNRLIHISSKYGQKEITNMLIALEADVNIKNSIGDTPLHIASKNNKYEIMQILITHGANIRAKNNKGESPVFHSILANSVDGLRLLFNNGASLIDVDNEGNTLLHHAIKYAKDKYDIINYLVQNGVPMANNVNKKNESSYDLIMKLMNIENKNNKSVVENFSVTEFDASKVSKQKLELLRISTLLRNYGFRGEESIKEYKSYDEMSSFNSPVELINKVCVKTENSPDRDIDSKDIKNCVRNGGQVVTITDPSVKISAQLYKSGLSKINELDKDELYYPIYGNKSKLTNDPKIVTDLNSEIRYKKNKKNKNNNYNFLNTNSKLVSNSKNIVSKENDIENDIENNNKEYSFNMTNDDIKKYENNAKINSDKFINIDKNDSSELQLIERFGDIVGNRENMIHYRKCILVILALLIVLFIIKNK